MGLPNPFPHEVMGAPHTMYVHATPGTAVPGGHNTPNMAADQTAITGAGWTLVGTRGTRSYTEDGVRVNTTAAYEYFRGQGSAAPIKVFRTEEDVEIGVSLADMTLESLALALNKVPGDVDILSSSAKGLGFSRGLGVKQFAVLLVGPSPYMDDGQQFFWVPNAACTSSGEMAITRRTATQYPLTFRSIWYDDAEEGYELGGIYAERS